MADQGQPCAFDIRIQGDRRPVSCDAGERVLYAVERSFAWPAQPPLRVGCRQGGCGACRVRILSGEYETLKMSRAHVTEAEQQAGFALACRVIPTSDLVIEPAFISPQERLAMRRHMNAEA